MPSFRLRSWQDWYVEDFHDYVVTADTLEEAASLLQSIQEQANDGQSGIAHECVTTPVQPLEDSVEPTRSSSGIMSIDGRGLKLEDVIGET